MRSMRSHAWLVAFAVTACSARNCDNDALQGSEVGGGSSTDVTVAGPGGSGGGFGGETPIGGSGGSGGSGVAGDCDNDDVPEDFANDAAHCGTCDHACYRVDGCVQGSCIVVQNDAPGGIATDGTSLFYMRDVNGDAEIWQRGLDVDSEGLLHFVELGPISNHDLALMGGYFYTLLQDRIARTDGTVNAFDMVHDSVHFATLDNSVCWAAESAIHCNNPDTGLMLRQIPLSRPARGIAASGSEVYWLDDLGDLYRAVGGSVTPELMCSDFPASGLAQIVVADNTVYGLTVGAVHQCAVNAGFEASALELATPSAITAPGDLAFANGYLYLSNASLASEGVVLRIDVAAPDNAEVIYRTLTDGPAGYLLVTANHLFFSVPADGAVMRHRLDAGAFGEP